MFGCALGACVAAARLVMLPHRRFNVQLTACGQVSSRCECSCLRIHPLGVPDSESFVLPERVCFGSQRDILCFVIHVPACAQHLICT